MRGSRGIGRAGRRGRRLSPEPGKIREEGKREKRVRVSCWEKRARNKREHETREREYMVREEGKRREGKIPGPMSHHQGRGSAPP